MSNIHIPAAALAGIDARIEALENEVIALKALRAWCDKPEPARAPVDACYADCISPDVPDGHDTVLGYLARHHANVLDLIDPGFPGDTARDGWWLARQCKLAGLAPIYVDAPPILARSGIFQVRAYPLDMLQRRWG